MSKLAPNVIKIIDEAADICASFEREMMHMTFWCEPEVESPIEHIMFVALKTVAKINFIDRSEPYFDRHGIERMSGGYYLESQAVIGNFRVDFLIEWSPVCDSEEIHAWIIECDGHDFHEKTKEQAKRDKQRDRWFTANNYKVLRFSGSEIHREPFVVAAEIWKAITKREDIRWNNE